MSKTMKDGGVAPLEIQIAFNVLTLMLLFQFYDIALKDTIGNGKTIDELVGLK